jgi:hypothetical protein
MKVIFLDNDGVICLSNNWGTRNKKRQKAGISTKVPFKELPLEVRFDNFDKKAVKILNEVLEETGAELVVSSDWRFYATLEELGDYYESQGISKKPIGMTEKFSEVFPREWSALRFRAELELERYMEIERWLEQHPEVTKWVAVDDLDMSIDYLGPRFSDKNGSDKKPGLTNFVLTPKSNQGIKESGIKDRILHFLVD